MSASILDSSRVDAVELAQADYERYARHVSIPEVGVEGQKKLRAASVLCIGLGGLGSPVTMYLAAAGIGRLGLVDFDVVDRSNLQRQIAHGEGDIDRTKMDSAIDTLREINPGVQIDRYEERLTSANAMEIAAPYDVIIDGTDNFATRYLSNDLSVLLKKPNVYGSIFRFEGQCSVFAPHLGGPCYRCLFPDPPEPGTVPSCAEGGVLGVLPGIIGTMQALEAIKLILGDAEPLIGRLVHFDAWKFKLREVRLRRDPQCKVCGENPSVTELIDYEQFCGVAPAAADADEPASDELSVQQLSERLKDPDCYLLDVREPYEYEICRLDQSVLIPLGEVATRVDEIPTDREVCVMCRSGMRSAQAVQFLREAGVPRAVNVAGGILDWADKMDPSMPKY